MKSFKQFISEQDGDELGLHGKKVPVNTDHFEGHAHIEFDRIKRGRHRTHSYKVTYKGKGGHPKHGGKTEDHEHMSFMDVEHDNGRPYKYKDYPHSSKDLHTLIHKAAPRWVSVEDLKPRPRNEEHSLQEAVDKDAVHRVLHHPDSSYRLRYVDKEGNRFHGVSVNDMPTAMRDHGYRRVSRDHSDSIDLRDAGFKIRHGAYDQGVKPTGKHVAVVHAFDHGSKEHQAMLQKQHSNAKERLAKTREDDRFGQSIHTSRMRSTSDAHKKLFGKDLQELTTRGLNAYKRGAEEDMEHETSKGKPDWERVTKRQKGIEWAMSKIRNVDVKVKASDSRKRPWPLHPIKVVTRHD